MGDIDLQIPKLRSGSSLSSILEQRRRVDQALYAVVMEAYVAGVSTRKVDALVAALDSQSGISKSQVSRICSENGLQVQAFLNRPLENQGYAYLYLDATYLQDRLFRAMQACSMAVVVAMGVNADGRRERLGIKVGDSENERFWSQFLGSLKERGLTGDKLVINDAHSALTNAIRRMLQGSCWQRCRVHLARNLLQTAPKAYKEVVAAALRCVFAQQYKEAVLKQWGQVGAMLAAKFPRADELMAKAREDVHAFRHFPPQNREKIWSTNLLERVNEEIKRRTRVVGIFPNDPAIERLVRAVLMEEVEHWQIEGRRMFSADSMAEISALDDLPAQACVHEATV